MGATVVVAGASMAGRRAAEPLRAAGRHGPITLVGDEPHMPYDRPPLSKEVLAGRASFDSLALRPRATVHDVRWRLGTRVVGADLGRGVVHLDDGGAPHYGAFVLGLDDVRVLDGEPEGDVLVGYHRAGRLVGVVALGGPAAAAAAARHRAELPKPPALTA